MKLPDDIDIDGDGLPEVVKLDTNGDHYYVRIGWVWGIFTGLAAAAAAWWVM